jgi:hypothetical protein
MADVPSNDANTSTTSSQIVAPSTEEIENKQKSTEKAKTPPTPSDGLAVAGLFVVIGLFSTFFPAYSNTPSIQGICQFIAYSCYTVGFVGGLLEISKLTKSQFWDTFGIGIFGVASCLGVNWVADLFNSNYIVSLVLRVIMLLPVAIAAYGIIRGILYLIIKDDARKDIGLQDDNHQSVQLTGEKKLQPEQIAGIAIAMLSVVTALIQSAPSLLPFFKQLLHIP